MRWNFQGDIMSLFSKQKKLIISGCSYTHNYCKTQKLEEFPIWGELLAEKLDMELINLSKCGFGNKAIYTTLVESMVTEKNVGLVIPMWSEFQRLSLFIDTATLDHLPKRLQNPDPWRCFLPERIVLDADWHEKFYTPPAVNPKKQGRKYDVSKVYRDRQLDNIKNGVVESLGYMFAFQNISKNLNIPHLQMQGCPPCMGKDMPKEIKNYNQLGHCLIGSPYIDKFEDNFIGWPIVSTLGGFCFDTLMNDAFGLKQKKAFKSFDLYFEYRISQEDTHPNALAHQKITELMYDTYKELYPNS